MTLVSPTASRSTTTIQLDGKGQSRAARQFIAELGGGRRGMVLMLSWSLFLKYELEAGMPPRASISHPWADAEAPAAMARLLEWVQVTSAHRV